MGDTGDKSERLRDWLLHTGRYVEGFESFTEELARALNLFGFDVSRLNLGVYILHPDIAGVAFQWHRSNLDVLTIPVEHEDLNHPIYLKSPIRACVESGEVIRLRVMNGEGSAEFPVVDDFRDEGITDYGVVPLPGGSGRMNVWSVATEKEGGFEQEEWEALQNFGLYLSLVVDYLAVQWLAGVLMQVYLGQRTGQRVLKGQVKRGDGQRIKAALWYCDMRDFTKMSAALTSEELIVVLNEYFGHLGPAVQSNDGEILKFIGDAMLAIFPVDDSEDNVDDVCRSCLDAAQKAQQTLSQWSQDRISQGQLEIRSGIAMHLGEVVYGNIGTPGRLDFTVIGEAVNRVARVEAMCGSLGQNLLATHEFISHIDASTSSLGEFVLKGIKCPVEIFAFE